MKPATDEAAKVNRYKLFFKNEMEAMALYQALSEVERDPKRADAFMRLAKAEQRHAARWAKMLNYEDSVLETAKPGMRIWVFKTAARIFGTSRVVPILIMGESQDIKAYAQEPDTREIVKDEREHSQTLRMLGNVKKGDDNGIREDSPTWGSSSGSLRAAVLGVNDGLVSNFSLVMGIAGGSDQKSFVLLAGITGLLAGAFSMAAGEYVSMRSQKDMLERQIQMEREELEQFPEEEEYELSRIYMAKGFTSDEAKIIAKRVISNPKVAIDTMAHEEMGMNLKELGSPWGAAASSSIAFSLGALVPIFPYVLGIGGAVLSAILSAVALLTVGGALSWTAGKSFTWGAIRMLLAGGAAATVTFLIGNLIGVSIAG